MTNLSFGGRFLEIGVKHGSGPTVSAAAVVFVVARQCPNCRARQKQRHGLLLATLQPILRPHLQQRDRAHAEIRPCPAGVSHPRPYSSLSHIILPLTFFFSNMTGIEYLLLHVQDPVLYVIRKVRRLSPEKGT